MVGARQGRRLPGRAERPVAVEAVKGRAKCASKGRVKVCHLREVICREVGSWIPTTGITEELARGEPTQDGDRKFNTDIA